MQICPMFPIALDYIFKVIILVLTIHVLQILLLVGFHRKFRQNLFTCLYTGRVKHTRLKGGAFHHLDYPLFFAYVDLDEMETIRQNWWLYWPIFFVDDGTSSIILKFLAFCSFDYKQHLKDFKKDRICGKSLISKVRAFIHEKSQGKVDCDNGNRIQVLTHLTYFGYCFNPISIYYIKDSNNLQRTEVIIAEVSNTPWIEMHSYMLHDSVVGVKYKHIDDETNTHSIEASWKKEFHVSPFMEMDYEYSFTFFEPSDSISVQSKLLKLSTNETWFTASFELKKLEFSLANLLYVLVFYPLHTRWIQVLIHFEAVKLFLKGVPTFDHPNGTDVDFGFGITGKRLGQVLYTLGFPFFYLLSIFDKKTPPQQKQLKQIRSVASNSSL